MYSADFRCQALRLLHTFGSYYRAAKACGISTSTLHRWNTTLANRTRCVPPKRKLTLAVLDRINQMLVESTGVLTLHHIQIHLERSGSRLCRQTISHAVKHLCGFSRKRVSRPFGGKKNPDMQKLLVDAFEETIRQRTQGGPPIVSVDECYFSEKVLPLYGYSPMLEERPPGDGRPGRREVHDDEVPWVRQRPAVDLPSSGCFGNRPTDAVAWLEAVWALHRAPCVRGDEERWSRWTRDEPSSEGQRWR